MRWTLFFTVLLVFSLSLPINGEEQSTSGISFSLLSPSGGIDHYSYLNQFKNNLNEIGMDPNRIQAGWEVIGSRSFLYPADQNGIPDFDSGGYDTLAISLGAELLSPQLEIFHKDYFPHGLNFAGIQDSDLSILIDTYYQSFDYSEREEIAYQIQLKMYEEIPYLPMIRNEIEWYVHEDVNMTSNQILIFDEGQTSLDIINFGGNDHGSLVVGQTFDLRNFLPFRTSNLDFSKTFQSIIFPGLYQMHFTSNDQIQFKEALAGSSISWNEDYTIAHIDINASAKFSNNNSVEAWDVVNTYRMHLTPMVDSDNSVELMNALDLTQGNNSISIVDHDTIQFNFAKRDFRNHKILTYGILDDDVIGNYTNGVHPIYNDGGTSDLGSGPNHDTYSFSDDPLQYGVGAGAYEYDTIEIENDQPIKLIMNRVENFWSGDTAMLENILFVRLQEPIDELLENSTLSITNSINIHDLSLEDYPQYEQVDFISLSNDFLCFNMNHPVFGTGEDTPLGQNEPESAKLAAKYVRKAIAHLFPDEIDLSDTQTKNIISSESMWPEYTMHFDPNVPTYEYDFNKAIELLELAGYEIDTEPPVESDANIVSYTTGMILGLIVLIIRSKKKIISYLEIQTESPNNLIL